MTTTTTIKKMKMTPELKKLFTGYYTNHIMKDDYSVCGDYMVETKEYGFIEYSVSVHMIFVKYGNEFIEYTEVFVDENGNNVNYDYMFKG